MQRLQKYLKILLITIVLLLSSWWIVHSTILKNDAALAAKNPDDIRIATYNVHYIWADRATGPWSVGDWERRKAPLSAAVTHMDADIIGFQEMETFGRSTIANTNLTLEWLQDQHPAYTAAAVGNPETFPSTQPIFFRTDRFILNDQGWFFFSKTPDKIYSRTFNGSYPAFASWVELEDRKTDNTFKIVNVHTDFQSYRNRQQSLALVRDRITPWLSANETVFVIGDYNAWRGSRLQRIMTDADLRFAPVTAATYHFNRGLRLFPAIDHIAFSKDVTYTSEPVVVQQPFLHEWPSDHYPVVVDIKIDANN